MMTNKCKEGIPGTWNQDLAKRLRDTSEGVAPSDKKGIGTSTGSKVARPTRELPRVAQQSTYTIRKMSQLTFD